MAEEGVLLNATQRKLDIPFNSALSDSLKHGHDRAEYLQRQGGEHPVAQSWAQEYEVALINDQYNQVMLTPAQEGGEEHEALPKALKKIKKLEAKVQKMKMSKRAAIPQDWKRARLLRDQSAMISKNQIEIKDLEASLLAANHEAEQKHIQVQQLKQELKGIRRAHREVEAVSQQRLEELRSRLEMEGQLLCKQANEKARVTEQHLDRLRRRSEARKVEHRKENALLKLEICELQNALGDTGQELRERLKEIETYSIILAGNDGKISELSQSVDSLKTHRAILEQETTTKLIAAQGDTVAYQRKLEIATHELQKTQDEFRAVFATISTTGSAMEVVKSVCNHLRQHSQSEKFCDPSHSQYRHLTHCGTLLCSDCLQQALPDAETDVVLEIGSKDRSENTCSWCRSDFWSWETLAIPYSADWMTDLENLINMIDQFTPAPIKAEAPAKGG